MSRYTSVIPFLITISQKNNIINHCEILNLKKLFIQVMYTVCVVIHVHNRITTLSQEKA